jgi:tol-pal system protein YbgF
MAIRERQIWLLLALGLLVLPSGCATQGSVSRLQQQVAGLQATVEATSRDVSSMLKASEGRLGDQGRQLEALGERLERLERERRDARLQDLDRTLKDLKESIDALRSPTSRLPGTAPADAEKAYASAQTHYQARNFGQAVLEFSDLIQHFPHHPLAENAQYWIAAAYLSARDFRQALLEFQKVADRYPGGRKTSDALYQLGVCYRNLFEPDRARETWRQLVRRFPESDAARLARRALGTGTSPPRTKTPRS